MTLDIGTHLLIGIITASAAATLIAVVPRKRTTASDALKATWEAWREVSLKALDRSLPVPPPPSEHHGKR